jgi:acyl-CoA synthetase (NDP forming)
VLPELTEETQAELRDALPTEASVGNPVDLLGSATAASYGAALPIMLADPGIDALIALFVPPVAVDEDAVGAAITRGAEAAHGKPVLCSFLSQRGAPSTLRVPSFSYPEAAARALGRAAERAAWLRRPAGSVPELDVDRAAAAAVVEHRAEGWLESAEARTLLEAYGLPLVEERLAASPKEAAEAAEALGYPVVVKTAVAGAHKTETGGVILDLDEEVAVWEAASRLGGPVLVQKQILGGAELFVGVVQDPMFGPLVGFGPGGILAELIDDAAFRLAPLTDIDARELVGSGRAGRLVGGFRGRPPADADALVDLLLRLSRLAADFHEVAELDLNPVIALTDGCVAVDARVRVAPPPQRHVSKTW